MSEIDQVIKIAIDAKREEYGEVLFQEFLAEKSQKFGSDIIFLRPKEVRK